MKNPRFTRYQEDDPLNDLMRPVIPRYRFYESSWLQWNFVIYLPVVHRLYLIQSSTCRSILKPAALEIHSLYIVVQSQVVYPASLHFVGKRSARWSLLHALPTLLLWRWSPERSRIAMIRDDKSNDNSSKSYICEYAVFIPRQINRWSASPNAKICVRNK